MAKTLKEIKSLLMATNLPERQVDLLAMFIHSLTPRQMDAAHTVLNQLVWETKLVT